MKIAFFLNNDKEENKRFLIKGCTVLEMEIWIYWSNQILEFIFYIHVYIYLNKNRKIYWSEQSFTGLGSADRCSSRGLGTSQTISYAKTNKFRQKIKQNSLSPTYYSDSIYIQQVKKDKNSIQSREFLSMTNSAPPHFFLWQLLPPPSHLLC